jgi:hypothetical protein
MRGLGNHNYVQKPYSLRNYYFNFSYVNVAVPKEVISNENQT